MGFESWESFNDDLLELPWKGHVYRIPEMRADVAIWLRVVAEKPGTKTPLDKMTDAEQATAVLGEALDKMLADGAPDEMVARATQTAMADWSMGRAAAEIVWRDGVTDPKAVAQKIARTLSPSTVEVGKTRKPGSSKGTSSRAKAARKSPGHRSSNSGT